MRARVPRVDYVNGRTLDTIDLTTALICVSTETDFRYHRSGHSVDLRLHRDVWMSVNSELHERRMSLILVCSPFVKFCRSKRIQCKYSYEHFLCPRCDMHPHIFTFRGHHQFFLSFSISLPSSHPCLPSSHFLSFRPPSLPPHPL